MHYAYKTNLTKIERSSIQAYILDSNAKFKSKQQPMYSLDAVDNYRPVPVNSNRYTGKETYFILINNR